MKWRGTTGGDRFFQMKRRDFVFNAAGAALVAADAAAAPRPSKVKFGACDWTLKLAADPASLDLAKRIGLDGVQVEYGTEPMKNGRLPLFDEKLQDQFLEKSEALGIAIPSLAMGILNKVGLKNDAAADVWVMESVSVAKRMKARVVLLAFFGNGDLRNDEAGVQSVIEKLRRLAPRASAAGVTYGVESWLKVAELERILDAVNSPAIKAYYDVGNMDKEGEDISAAIRRLGRERICEFHAKDYTDLYGIGSIDFAKVRDAMNAIDYSGWMHIEGTKLPNGIEKDVRHDLEHLRGVFAK